MQETAKYNVLIVDDSRTMRLMLKTALEEANYFVMEAESGEKAIELFQESSPDIVLLDVEMKGMNGIAACKELRRLAGNALPIVMMSGSDVPNALEDAYAAGATDFINKPTDYDLIGDRLRSIILSSKDKNV